jgi:hypothetical protein
MIQVREPVVCVAEDRASMEPGLRLLVHSLSIHSPTFPTLIFYPPASDDFKAWLAQYPNCTLRTDPIEGSYSKYGVKPNALLQLLDEGYSEVIWLDSDLVLAKDISSFFSDLSPSEIVITEEALVETRNDEDGLRARLWGMEVGRSFPFVLNTAVLRVTSEHRALLDRWKELLASTEYRNAQLKVADLHADDPRPIHLFGDQDVLSALLTSKEFAHVPLRILRRGRDIVQFFGPYGYTVADRLYHLANGFAPLVHAMGQKPWWPHDSGSGLWTKFSAVYAKSSPYTAVASGYERALTSTDWLKPKGTASRAMNSLGFLSPALVGFPIAAFADVVRFVKFTKSRLGRAVPSRGASVIEKARIRGES